MWHWLGRFLLVTPFMCLGCAQRGDEGPVANLPASQAGELQAARSGFDAAKEPSLTAETRFAAGRLAESRGDVNQAVRQYNEALKLQPGHTGALYQLGVLHTQLKNFPQAVEVWTRYVSATGQSATAYANLGFCHESAGRTHMAERAYRQGIDKEPANRPCRVNLGLLLARQGLVAEAKEHLSVVLPPEEVNYNLGSVFEQEGLFSLARTMYEAALTVSPDFEPARTRLSHLPAASGPAPGGKTGQ